MSNMASNDVLPGDVADAYQAGTEVPGGPEETHDTYLGMDSYGWVALAFFIFMGILWKIGAFRAMGSALDAQATRVRSDLDEAASLRAEAEALKAKAAADAAQAEADARAIIANASVEAERIVEQANMDAQAAIARRTRIAEDRIAADARAVEAELRARAADITIKAAQNVLAERAGRGELSGLVDTAISRIDQR